MSKDEEYEIHKAVFHNDIKKLKELLCAGNLNIDKKDVFGNTPLHLATMLGFSDCTKLLTEYNADTNIKNKHGWTALAESVSYGSRQSIKSVLRRAKEQNKKALEDRRPKLVSTLKELKDFQLQLKWEFHSWGKIEETILVKVNQFEFFKTDKVKVVFPLISRLLPSDTCKISKKGANIRMDTTLIEFTDMKWQRGDISFLFNGAKSDDHLGPNNILVLDNLKHVYQKLRRNDLEVELDEEIDYLMSNDIVTAQMSTKPITFSPAQSGWIFKADKTEFIGDMNCDVYNVHGMVLMSRKRREHLSEEDLQKNKAMVEALHKGDSLLMENEKCQTVTRKDSLPVPPPCPFSWSNYVTSSGMPCLGRMMALSESKRPMKVNVWMSDEFPLTTDLILSVLNVVAPSKHFEKIKDFVSLKLPPGFPVKIEIPVLPTIVARITFQDFKWTEDLSDDLFTIPSNFTEDPFHFPEL